VSDETDKLRGAGTGGGGDGILKIFWNIGKHRHRGKEGEQRTTTRFLFFLFFLFLFFFCCRLLLLFFPDGTAKNSVGNN
jgi:hypothetical protein